MVADLEVLACGGVGSMPADRAVDGAASPVDHQRIQRAVREILFAIGENPDREGLQDTPARVARAYAELFAGLHQDPAVHLARVFEESTGELVAVRNINFSSICEHHLLPFIGRAHVAYVPAGSKVVGLSKLARTVDVLARRPQVQERLTAQVADAIASHLGAAAVAVVIESEHLCMKVRGACKHEASMVTTAFRGQFRSDSARRAEVLSVLLKRD
jgi:GTP cyclohydrolase I